MAVLTLSRRSKSIIQIKVPPHKRKSHSSPKRRTVVIWKKSADATTTTPTPTATPSGDNRSSTLGHHGKMAKTSSSLTDKKMAVPLIRRRIIIVGAWRAIWLASCEKPCQEYLEEPMQQ